MNSLMSKPECCPAPPTCSEKPKPSGPSVYLNPEQTKAMFGTDTPEVGEVYATGVKFKVRSWEAGDHGVRATLELTECESCEGAEETADTEEAD